MVVQNQTSTCQDWNLTQWLPLLILTHNSHAEKEKGHFNYFQDSVIPYEMLI